MLRRINDWLLRRLDRTCLVEVRHEPVVFQLGGDYYANPAQVARVRASHPEWKVYPCAYAPFSSITRRWLVERWLP